MDEFPPIILLYIFVQVNGIVSRDLRMAMEVISMSTVRRAEHFKLTSRFTLLHNRLETIAQRNTTITKELIKLKEWILGSNTLR